MVDNRDTATRPSLPDAATALANLAQRQIAVFSERLDASVFGTPEFVAAIRALVVAHPRHHVRLLIRSTEGVRADGDHRLVELARTVPSRISLRSAPEVACTATEEWLIIDRAHVLRRLDATARDYLETRDNPGQARQRLTVFDRWWEHGEAPRELAALRL